MTSSSFICTCILLSYATGIWRMMRSRRAGLSRAEASERGVHAALAALTGISYAWIFALAFQSTAAVTAEPTIDATYLLVLLVLSPLALPGALMICALPLLPLLVMLPVLDWVLHRSRAGFRR